MIGKIIGYKPNNQNSLLGSGFHLPDMSFNNGLKRFR